MRENYENLLAGAWWVILNLLDLLVFQSAVLGIFSELDFKGSPLLFVRGIFTRKA